MEKETEYFYLRLGFPWIHVFCLDMPRALTAPDTSHPHGTPQHRHHNLTVIQHHCAFFDRDNNGIIYPWETYMGKSMSYYF